MCRSANVCTQTFISTDAGVCFKNPDQDAPSSILVATNSVAESPDYQEQVLQVLLAADKEFGTTNKKSKKKGGTEAKLRWRVQLRHKKHL